MEQKSNNKIRDTLDGLLCYVVVINFRKKVFKENSSKESLKLKLSHYIVACIDELLRLAEERGCRLCENNNSIYLFTGKHWEKLDNELLKNFLENVALKMGIDEFECKHHKFKDELFKQFLSSAYLQTPKFKKNTTLINLQNGTLEINDKNFILREHRPNDFMIYVLPFEYNENATAEQYAKFLNYVLRDKVKQKVLAEYFAYIFISREVLKLEKVLLLFGKGANGKSVVFEVLNALLGEINVSNYSLQNLTDQSGYYRAMIANVLLNYSSEISGKMETHIFKQLASGEPVDARLPYGKPFRLNNYAKLIFNCNQLPANTENSNAYFRRFLIINFDVTIPENLQDKELSKKIIESELSGVLNWVLAGLSRLLEQKNFTECKAIEDEQAEYKDNHDTVKMFLSENEFIKSDKGNFLIKDFYFLYRNFCTDGNFKSVNRLELKNMLIDSGIEVKKTLKGISVFAEKFKN